MDGFESRCKRLDHKILEFSIPFFKSYDCDGAICRDFRPSRTYKFFHDLWHDWYIRFYVPKKGKTLPLTIKGEGEVSFHVSYLDFFNDTFRNEDGSLRWLYKEYYIPTRYSPIGYLLVKEYPDGTFGRGGELFRNKSELIAKQKAIHFASVTDFAFRNLMIYALRKSKIHNKDFNALVDDCLPHMLEYIRAKCKEVRAS